MKTANYLITDDFSSEVEVSKVYEFCEHHAKEMAESHTVSRIKFQGDLTNSCIACEAEA